MNLENDKAKLNKVVSIVKTPHAVEEIIDTLVGERGEIVDIIVGYREQDGIFMTAWSVSRPEMVSYLTDILKLRVADMIRELG